MKKRGWRKKQIAYVKQPLPGALGRFDSYLNFFPIELSAIGARLHTFLQETMPFKWIENYQHFQRNEKTWLLEAK